jgi:hypothetical protein
LLQILLWVVAAAASAPSSRWFTATRRIAPRPNGLAHPGLDHRHSALDRRDVGFGFYVTNFGSYNATYGSLGAVVVFLTWLYLTAYILLMGGELNSELEKVADPQSHPNPAS